VRELNERCREQWDFMRERKKWWQLPIVAVMPRFGLLTMLVSETPASNTAEQ
jgi:hypothetical protein